MSGKDKIRAFIAIELPEEARAELGRMIDALRKAVGGGGGKDLKWVNPDNIHLTLKFLGDVAPEMIDEVAGAMDEAASGTGPMSLAIGGVGGFPNLRSPRVVWAGLDAPEELAELHEALEDALAPLGFAPEERAFRPHLTLCRVKAPAAGRSIGPKAEALDPGEKVRFTAGSISLIKSVLTPKGPKYTVLKEVHLE